MKFENKRGAGQPFFGVKRISGPGLSHVTRQLPPTRLPSTMARLHYDDPRAYLHYPLVENDYDPLCRGWSLYKLMVTIGSMDLYC